MDHVRRNSTADCEGRVSARPRRGFVYVAQESARRLVAPVSLSLDSDQPIAIGRARAWRYSLDGIVQPAGLVKIGFTSKNPEYRFYDLARVTRRTIVVLAILEGTTADETALHASLASSHADTDLGTEWFQPTAEVQLAVDSINGGKRLRRVAACVKSAGRLHPGGARLDEGDPRASISITNQGKQ